jgi:ABC-type transport system substrate-binding protein
LKPLSQKSSKKKEVVLKRRTLWMVLACLLVTLLVLSSCGSSNSTGTTKTSTQATTTSVAGNFWAPLGAPQYGGSITLRTNKDFVSFDAFYSSGYGVKSAWEERLFTDDWTLDPTVWSYKLGYRPPEYVKGNLASSWEFTDPTTFTVHLRQGIHWQNIAPANGRELTADDIVFHFDRLYAMGGGFTKPSTVAPAATTFLQLNSVTATDKYTVVFKWKTSNPQFITETMQGLGPDQCIECPDAIKLWGDTNDWHHAIGTGPFMLTDFTSGSSATMVRNPNYWGYDERYPKNQHWQLCARPRLML